MSTPAFVRKHERIPFETECTLYFPDKKDILGRTLDISLGGMKVTTQEIPSLFHYIGGECLIEFLLEIPVEAQMKTVFLQIKATMVNGVADGVGLQFMDMDQEAVDCLKKLVLSTPQEGDLTALKGKSSVKIKAENIKYLKSQLEEYIVDSVKDIFIAFLAMDVIPGPFVERSDFDDYAPPNTEVTAVILFNGALEGGVHLAAPLHFAIKAAGAMLGDETLDFKNEQEAMVWDAIGEIANQVAGGVQTRISGDFEGVNLTPPNIIVGANFRINYSKNLSSVRQFFKTPAGPFFVECFFS